MKVMNIEEPYKTLVGCLVNIVTGIGVVFVALRGWYNTKEKNISAFPSPSLTSLKCFVLGHIACN